MNFIIITAIFFYRTVAGRSFDSELNPEWMGGLNEVPTIDDSIFHVCANTSWASGNPDIRATLYDCVARMADPLNCPSYLNNTLPTPVRVSMGFNNLMAISEVDSSVVMDFFYRLYWVDQRFNFPSLWEDLSKTKPSLLIDGIEMQMFIRDDSENLRVWLPDVYLKDAKELNVMVETIRIRPGGLIFWSRQVVATIQQAHFNYVKYPQDSQSIQLRTECYGLGGEYVDVNHTGTTNGNLLGYRLPTSVTLSTNEGEQSIKNNPTWMYQGYTTVINSVTYATNAFSRNEPIIYLNFQRLSEGIINRLALPIMLLILLVGLTFWGEHTSRVDSTITLLLAISALYIVVFSSIPMLGYLTNFDTYIISMFIMIVVAVFVHQITSRLMLKIAIYPLRMIVVRFLEMMGKLGVFPFVLLYFLHVFEQYGTQALRDICYTALCGVTLYLGGKEVSALRGDIKKAMLAVRNKIDNPATYTLTTIEVIVFNFHMFRIFSKSAAHYHRWKHATNKEIVRERSASNTDMGTEMIGNIVLPSKSESVAEMQDAYNSIHSL